MLIYGQKKTIFLRRKQSKNAQLEAGGVSQSGITSDLDQFEEPTADPETPEPGAPGPGAPGTDTRWWWNSARRNRWRNTCIRLNTENETERILYIWT